MSAAAILLMSLRGEKYSLLVWVCVAADVLLALASILIESFA